MLLDELFSALDAGLCASLREEFAQRITVAGIAAVLVTPDEAEERMAQRGLRLVAGRLQVLWRHLHGDNARRNIERQIGKYVSLRVGKTQASDLHHSGPKVFRRCLGNISEFIIAIIIKCKMPSPRSRPTVIGKLSRPRLGRVTLRERLFREMDQVSSAPGIWISGPPGIGKTTLVATYLDTRALPCLWLQLDSGDVDPATFVHFLSAAANQLEPQRKLRLPRPSADDLRDVPDFIRRCFRRLAAALEGPWVLVLDNLQELGQAPVLHAGLAASLAELPLHARLIAISREPPGSNYARALSGQQLALIEASALHFNETETQQLVHLHGRNWQPAALRQATDGWAAAMILMLAARSDLDASTAAHSGTTRERLFAFFAGEVLQKMSPSDATSLMRIAFLPSASASVAVAMAQDAHAADLLADLARRSLFTDCREGTEPTYTFHGLFGEFLRARAGEQLDAQGLYDLRIAAAQLLAANGQVDAAITQLIDTTAWNEALSLLITAASSFAAQGRTAAVLTWVRALPIHVQQTAQAAYWLGYCEMATEPASALKHLARAHHAFEAAADTRGAFFAAAAAADAIVSIGDTLAGLEAWLPTLKDYAPTYLINRNVETDLRVLPGLLGAFVHLDTGHPLTAPLAGLAERLLDQPLAASQRILLGSLAYYLLWTGQSVRLDRIMIKIDRMSAAPDMAAPTLLRWYGVAVLIRSLQGGAAEALAYACRALDLAETGSEAGRAKAHLMMVLAALAGRNAELARKHLNETASLLDAANPIDATTYEFQRGLLMLLGGDWASAALSMQAAVASGRASNWPLREHIALLGQTLTCTQTGAYADSEDALLAVKAHRFYAVCPWHQWLAALIEAQLASKRHDEQRCLQAIGRAFALGRKHGYNFGPMPYCCGDMMSRLASLALAHGIDAPFALQIISRHALPAPPDAGESWPWPIRLYTLGQFRIEHGGSAPKASRKESRKPLDLLKLLIALGGSGSAGIGSRGTSVPISRLSAALWPDTPGDAARNSFDNALHRLRKLLGGDQYVLLNSGGLSLNAATCWTDLAEFEDTLAAVDPELPQADTAQISAWAQRLLSLYKGAFLVGEEDLPDVLVRRERVQAKFTRQMGALGYRLQALGNPAAAALVYERVVEQQPLAEDIYRRLISCLITLERTAEAYAVYRRCRQQLSVVLGIRPAQETEALVASLRNL